MKPTKRINKLIAKRDRLKAESDVIDKDIATLEKSIGRLENLRDTLNHDYSECVYELGMIV